MIGTKRSVYYLKEPSSILNWVPFRYSELYDMTSQQLFKPGQQPHIHMTGILAHIIAGQIVAFYQHRAIRGNRHIPTYVLQMLLF